MATILDIAHYRYLKLKSLNDSAKYYENSERDISLLILAIGELPQNDLTENSEFYDLETNILDLPLPTEEYYFVFYKGACLDSEEEDNVLTNTGIFIIPRGIIKSGKLGVDYWKNPINEDASLKGASGSGLWMFYRKNHSGNIKKSLRGVNISNPKGSVKAISSSFIHDTLLPKVKQYLSDANNCTASPYFLMAEKYTMICIKTQSNYHNYPCNCHMNDELKMTKIDHSITTLKSINKHHLGIYGIVLKDDSILLVRKSRGPYTGKLDLPGGKPEHGETPSQTLAREVLEETGVVVQTARVFENYGTVAQQVNQDNIQENIHHIGMVYLVESYDDAGLITEMDAEDSLGAQWYRLATLTKDMLSPFAFEAVTATANNDHQNLFR